MSLLHWYSDLLQDKKMHLKINSSPTASITILVNSPFVIVTYILTTLVSFSSRLFSLWKGSFYRGKISYQIVGKSKKFQAKNVCLKAQSSKFPKRSKIHECFPPYLMFFTWILMPNTNKITLALFETMWRGTFNNLFAKF